MSVKETGYLTIPEYRLMLKADNQQANNKDGIVRMAEASMEDGGFGKPVLLATLTRLEEAGFLFKLEGEYLVTPRGKRALERTRQQFVALTGYGTPSP